MATEPQGKYPLQFHVIRKTFSLSMCRRAFLFRHHPDSPPKGKDQELPRTEENLGFPRVRNARGFGFKRDAEQSSHAFSASLKIPTGPFVFPKEKRNQVTVGLLKLQRGRLNSVLSQCALCLMAMEAKCSSRFFSQQACQTKTSARTSDWSSTTLKI